MSQPSRRPGDRVIRRRFHSRQEIRLPEAVERPSVPNVRSHAKRFVLGLAGIVLLGALLLALPWTTRSGEATPIVDALFVAMSATSVTGLVTVDTGTHWNPFGQVIILVLIQTGGLGFMVGASLVLRILGRGTSRRLRNALLIQDGSPTLTVHEAVRLSRRIVKFTFITEAIGAVLLTIGFLQDNSVQLAIWKGIFHAVSAFCNAGFDIQGNFSSLIDYRESVWMNVVFMVLIQLGALSYIALADVVTRRNWRRLATNTKLILSLHFSLLAISMSVFLAAEWNGALANTAPWARPMGALFHGVAARTSGFSTVNFAEATPVSEFIWSGLMAIGGAPGSTAGGVKITTVGIILVAVLSTLRGQTEPQVFNRRLPIDLVLRAMGVVTLFFFAHFLTTAALAATERLWGGSYPFNALFFESMSALATVGLSTGITPNLSEVGKIVLIFAMFFGRIGPLTAAYALQQRESKRRYRYPETTVHIG